MGQKLVSFFLSYLFLSAYTFSLHSLDNRALSILCYILSSYVQSDQTGPPLYIFLSIPLSSASSLASTTTKIFMPLFSYRLILFSFFHQILLSCIASSIFLFTLTNCAPPRLLITLAPYTCSRRREVSPAPVPFSAPRRKVHRLHIPELQNLSPVAVAVQSSPESLSDTSASCHTPPSRSAKMSTQEYALATIEQCDPSKPPVLSAGTLMPQVCVDFYTRFMNFFPIKNIAPVYWHWILTSSLLSLGGLSYHWIGRELHVI